MNPSPRKGLRASMTVRLSPQLDEAVRRICREKGLPRAVLVRNLLADWASSAIVRDARSHAVIDDREQYLAAERLPEVKV